MGDSLIGTTISFLAPAAPKSLQENRGGTGSQVLPVAEINDSFDGTGEPMDGMQYLFMVRKQASEAPEVVRAEGWDVVEDVEMEPEVEEVDLDETDMPSEIWKESFIDSFSKLRFKMLNTLNGIKSQEELPNAKDPGSWKTFINGRLLKQPQTVPKKKEISVAAPVITEEMDLEAAKAALLASLEFDTDAAIEEEQDTITAQLSSSFTAYDPTRLPHLPAPTLLLSISHPTALLVLLYITQWMDELLDSYDEAINYQPSTMFAPLSIRKKSAQIAPKKEVPNPLPTHHELHWILSLLLRVDSLCSGSEISILRELAKMIRKSIEYSCQNRTDEDEFEEEQEERRALGWMVIAAVSQIWSQTDLW